MSERNLMDSSGRVVLGLLGEFGNIVNNMDSEPASHECPDDEFSSSEPPKRVCFALNEDRSSDVDDPVDSPPQTRRQCRKWSELKKEPFQLQCEWRDCTFTSFTTDEFCTHVSDHIPHLDVRSIEEEEIMAVYVCLWAGCEREITTSDEAIRHVYYHGFHTKLKSIGARMMADENHPKCLLNQEDRNVIIALDVPFRCYWDRCEVELQSAQKFYYHVQAHAVSHVSSLKRSSKLKKVACCLWRGCRAQPRGLQRLQTHLQSHTKEKRVGCPVCGGTFASKTKFYDHCSRQVPKNQNEYQCSHCARSYSSERLLRDHMRHHVNSYKCPLCDMTSPTPSSLSLHIRNRHIADKPFKCDYCEYRAKTQHNLDIHMSVHYSQALYRCEAEGCGFTCRTIATLNKHARREHGEGSESVYCCHICDKRYSKGAKLSNHLCSTHNFRLPSGHSRFRYKADSEGLFRLETVRYESLEVTQEMIQEPQSQLLLLEDTPLFIAYETLDQEGNITSQLVGGHPLPEVPVVFLETHPEYASS